MYSTGILRTFNYFYFSLLAIFISYIPVYLSARGVSKTQIGVIIGIGAFIGIISQPFWGYLSDKYKTVKKIIILTLGISICIGTLLFQSSSFPLLLLLVGLMYFFFLPTDPLTESLNYQVSEKLKISFGSIRMFGAIGFASTSLIVGYLADSFGMGNLTYVFLCYGIAAFLVCLTLPDTPASGKQISLKDLKGFLTYPQTIRFFLLVLITALPHRMNDNFLGVYIQSLGGSTALVGQAWFVAAITEVVFFAISYKFLRKGKELQLISIAAAFYTVRYFFCAFAVQPEWVVYLQLLHGCTFVVFYTAAIQYLYANIPEEWKSTGQTALAIIFFGISGIIGSFLGGWVFDTWGGTTLYLLMSILSFSSIVFRFILMREQKSEQPVS